LTPTSLSALREQDLELVDVLKFQLLSHVDVDDLGTGSACPRMCLSGTADSTAMTHTSAARLDRRTEHGCQGVAVVPRLDGCGA